MVLGMGPYDDPIIGNEVETMNIFGYLLVGSNYFYCLLYCSSKTMMTEMPLQPVISMGPLGKIT